ncbi:dipeptide/oligopeptide/nickel ABC transporter permease/ATP-binding protein [Microbacterium sp. KSW4-11]|uniref:Dipeptide/oligopeptide/nickel ABC transporter permease/ATP-binding protein n=1 Tax=Microbacterium gawkjiense TaxID=3067309 RepID=A0ABU3G992_9MICO|nr:dipeptide/oligopeptide/nickel ABC transporter permease/ATP-binding protein [Microbacterium sp. KSW4-11]MDT3316387.1 dipeptide/oligopeptide/nickel ABC transporter permease/ATP-binding protein [Microbacterium sp. KSW4-11]
MSAPRSGGVGHALVTRPLPIIAVAWLAIVCVGALLTPLLPIPSPTAQDLAATLQTPGPVHPLGTDTLGRDILSRLLYGARVTLANAALATAVALLLGTTIGLIAGYFRGVIDTITSAVADILLSVPSTVILLTIAVVVARNPTILMIVLGVLLSAGMFRAVRASTMDVRAELYISAARTSGLTEGQILARHVFPRILPITIVQGAVLLSLALVIQTGLGFLGIDVSPPNPSWGNMVADAASSLVISVWPIVPPTIVIGLTVLAISVIGDTAQQTIGGRTRRSGLGPRRRQAPARKGGVATDPRPQAERPLLRVSDVSITVPRSDGPLTLVDRVSFEIFAGSIVGLVGESGAGKSITARSLLGILPTDAHIAGDIWFEGHNIAVLSERELARLRGTSIAFIGQEPMSSLSPSFRIGNQLAEIVRQHRGVSRADARRISIELLESVDIRNARDVARLYPHEISGGMAQRVVIAIALAGDPQLLVADEPTTALDVSVQMQVLELLRSLSRSRGLAVLIVTHDWGVVADLCDSAIVMYAGEVVEAAAIEPIFDAPQHPYTRALRAADPHAPREGARLSAIPGQVPPPGSWPDGCRFASRCAFVTDSCRASQIPLRSYVAGHPVRCIRVQELNLVD